VTFEPPEFNFDEDFCDLASASPQQPRWLIPGFLPVGLCVLAGPPKTSRKSTWAIGASLVMTGTEVPVFPKEWRRPAEQAPRSVFIISAEADAGEVRWTAQDQLGVGAIPENEVFVATRPELFRLDQEPGFNRLMSHLDYHHPVLVVADPFRNLHSQNEDDSATVFGLLSPIQRWAKKNDACFLLVHHVNKSPSSAKDGNGEYGQNDMRGSGALPGVADGMLIVTPAGMSKEEDAQAAGEDAQVFNGIFKKGASWRKVVKLSGEVPAPSPKPLSKLEHEVLEFGLVHLTATTHEVARYLKRKESDVAKAIASLKERGLL
jgi:hypothetical protein